MASNLATFKSNHHYLSGALFIVVGVVGVYASMSGTLPSALAALWVPDILQTKGGGQADVGSGSSALGGIDSVATTLEEINPITGPLTWAEQTIKGWL